MLLLLQLVISYRDWQSDWYTFCWLQLLVRSTDSLCAALASCCCGRGVQESDADCWLKITHTHVGDGDEWMYDALKYTAGKNGYILTLIQATLDSGAADADTATGSPHTDLCWLCMRGWGMSEFWSQAPTDDDEWLLGEGWVWVWDGVSTFQPLLCLSVLLSVCLYGFAHWRNFKVERPLFFTEGSFFQTRERRKMMRI